MKKYLITVWTIALILVSFICMGLVSTASTIANIVGVVIFGLFVALSIETDCFTKNIFKK